MRRIVNRKSSLSRAVRTAARSAARSALVETLEGRRLLTTSVWTGAAGDHLFSDAGNWQSDTVPASGDDIEFNDLGSSQAVTFDTTGINVGNLYVSNNYTFSGNAVTLLGNVEVNPGGSATFNNTITIGANSNFTSDAGATMTLNTLSDNANDTLTKYGTGTLILDGSSDSQWQALTGTFTVDGNTDINLSTYGGQGAVVNGTGTVDSLSDNGADVTPGTGSTGGTLNSTSNLYFNGGNLNINLSSSAHGELTVGGSNVPQLTNNPDLVVSLASGFVPATGTVYTVINNTSGLPYNGTFNGLAEGAHFSAGGETFAISYVGGTSGHDVTLTAVGSAPSVTLTPSVSNTILGQSVKLTATVAGSNGTPSGTVSFYSGSTLLGTGTLSGGVASLSTTSLAAGTDSITAVYGGGGVYTSATSAASSVAVYTRGPVLSIPPTASLYTAKAAKLSATALDSSTSLTDSLTYTWITLTAPKGAKAPVFSANGTNAAATTTAAFSKDGAYSFEVIVKDSKHRTTASTVSYYVRQYARYLDIVPNGEKLKPGGHITFSTTALDQFRHAMRTNSTSTAYSVASGSGSITSAGVFTAGSRAGSVTIDVSLDKLTGVVGATVT